LSLDEDNVRAFADICDRVDGIPLAIELAAARLQVLTPRQLREKLADRFKLLTGGSAAVPHHRALRTTIDWSYDLLSRKEKMLFERLAVFGGGWTLAAAETVCRGTGLAASEILDILSALVNKSLVVADFQDTTETRFRYLETVREYSAERLSESADSSSAYSQHAEFFFDLAAEAHTALEKGERNPWLERLGRERDNFRSAFACSTESKRLSFAVSLWSFLRLAGHFSEGREYLERALAQESKGVSQEDRTRAQIVAGHSAILQGDYSAAEALFQGILETATRSGFQTAMARSHDALSEIARLTDRYEVAQRHAEESLSLWRALDNRHRIARSLSDLGEIARLREDYARARPLLEEGLTMQRQEGESEDVVQSLIRIGVMAQNQGDYALARSYVEESLVIAQRLQYQRGIEIAHNNLAVIATLQEDYASARAFNEECLRRSLAAGDRWGICSSDINLGVVYRGEGDYESARDILGKGLAIARELGTRRAVGAALNQLSITERLQGDGAAARSLSLEALDIFHDLDGHDGMAYALENLAALDLAEGRIERAVILWGVAERLRTECASPLPPGYRLDYDRAMAEARRIAGEESFANLWAQGARTEIASAVETAAKYRLTT
jgi:tetratricopeptide (TPR) repeat protein